MEESEARMVALLVADLAAHMNDPEARPVWAVPMVCLPMQ